MHRRIFISVMVGNDGGYLSPHDIIFFRNGKKDREKSTKKSLMFMEKLQMVLKYSREFKQEYNVTFSVPKIRDIVKKLKVSKYIRDEKSVKKKVSNYERDSRIKKFMSHTPLLIYFIKNLLHASFGAEDSWVQLELSQLDSRQSFPLENFKAHRGRRHEIERYESI